MPRELWAKVAVEIVRDPKLLRRKPWERWLWIGLICIAKETAAEDGVVRGYDAKRLSVILDLGVTAKSVQEALEYFAATKPSPMVRLLPDDAIELVHFAKRQAAKKDNPEAVAERQRRWRARHKGNGGITGTVTEPFTRDDSVTPMVDKGVTRNAEEEEEEEEEIYATADLARSGEAAAAISPDFKPLASFLAATWPAFNEPAKTAKEWTEAFPKLDLLAAARAARAKELATAEPIVSPGAYLQSWFDRAEARRVAGPKASSGNGRLTEGTPEWDAAKREADERAKRRIAETKALFEKRDRVQREGHE